MESSPIVTMAPLKKITIKVKKPLVFTAQNHRRDILTNMLTFSKLTGQQLFTKLITDNKTHDDKRRQGWVFETICQIVVIMKLVAGLEYSQYCIGQLDSIRPIDNVKKILDIKVEGGGNNIVDFILKQGNDILPFSVKYKNGYTETDVTKIDSTCVQEKLNNKNCLIVKNKQDIRNHKFNNQNSVDKINLDIVISNNLLFDTVDIVTALQRFCNNFKNNQLDTEDFITFINENYLLSSKKNLIMKTHQKMTLKKFESDFNINKKKMWCIAHKPRSGKSITLLSLCKYLLSIKMNKILIMTSVPATIQSFIDDLETYIYFKNIPYKTQDKFDSIDTNYVGIVFCSVQFLKSDSKITDKKALLKRIGFDVIISDESHQGSSTDKTKKEIIDVDIDDIRKDTKVSIFASGTADKTRKYYGIKPSFVYEWEIDDEAKMKKLQCDVNNSDAIVYMTNKHGDKFLECYNDNTLNKNYKACPIQVLMKNTIPVSLINEINNYNKKNNTTFGYSCSSLFALSKEKKEKENKNYDDETRSINDKNYKEYEYVYKEEFELCKSTDGEDILKSFFENIISSNLMNDNTIMRQIEATQKAENSRYSKVGNPLLFIIYLPTHSGNNTISILQKTIKSFLERNDLWSKYNIEYSNSVDSTGSIKEEYNEYIKTIMTKTVKDGKRGCILLLGDKGSVGITYKDCDVTISLDDGHNLDNQKQRFSRALTENEGKTIGINVDMNIQRSYLLLADMFNKHRKITKTTHTNAEILNYLYSEKIFIFDPHHLKNGKMTSVEIMSYYNNEAKNMFDMIDDTPFLESIICDDEMHDYIKMEFIRNDTIKKAINIDLEGEQQDCPKGDRERTLIDGNGNERPGVIDGTEIEDQNAIIENLINQTYELCKSFLFPLLALLSRSYKINDFKEIFVNKKTANLLKNLLRDKKIDVEKDNYIIITNIMNNIIDNNAEIINNIREIYYIASHDKLRGLIEKHFIPTNEEKKNNAEIPTPVRLVDEMLNIIPNDFWTSPKKVFEPCCGKGNFVLGIFDKFYKGLKEEIPDEIERCKVIMTECLYYADLTTLNVFITTEILKCHIESYTGLKNLDYTFKNYTGDTLTLNIEEHFSVNEFDAVIGNPPYQPSSNGKKGGSSIWNEFVSISLSSLLRKGGYLVFVHPALWRKPENKLQKIMFSKQIHYLSIHNKVEGKKLFGATTRFDYYLLENKPAYKSTKVVFEDKKVYNVLINDKLPFIPNFGWSVFEKVLQKLNGNGIMVNGDSNCHTARTYVSKTEKIGHDFKLLNSISNTKGKTFCYSSKPHNIQLNKKVLFSNGETIVPFYDNGELGITQGGLYVLVNDELEGNKMISYLNTNLIVYLMRATKWSNFETCKQLFWYIPSPNNIDGNISNETVNSHYGLSQEDINTIII